MQRGAGLGSPLCLTARPFCRASSAGAGAPESRGAGSEEASSTARGQTRTALRDWPRLSSAGCRSSGLAGASQSGTGRLPNPSSPCEPGPLSPPRCTPIHTALLAKAEPAGGSARDAPSRREHGDARTAGAWSRSSPGRPATATAKRNREAHRAVPGNRTRGIGGPPRQTALGAMLKDGQLGPGRLGRRPGGIRTAPARGVRQGPETGLG